MTTTGKYLTVDGKCSLLGCEGVHLRKGLCHYHITKFYHPRLDKKRNHIFFCKYCAKESLGQSGAKFCSKSCASKYTRKKEVYV